MRFSFLFVLLAISCVFLSSPSRAKDLYGSLSFNRDSGAYGFAYDYETLSAAIDRSQQECGTGCTAVLEFKNSCGAYAAGDGTSYGWGKAATKAQAQSIALEQCSQRGGGCQVHVWGCTTRAAESIPSGKSIEGDWLRVSGGSEKVLHIRGALGDFNVPWKGLYDAFRSFERIGENIWSCEAIYSNSAGDIKWTSACKAKLISDELLKIDFSYLDKNIHQEYVPHQ